MNETDKQKVREFMEQVLSDPSARISIFRPAIRTTQPGDMWETYAPSLNMFMLIVTGPPSTIEDNIKFFTRGDL